ncbi:MAG: amidase [Pyrinomonadaceae bacterium]
MKSGDNEITALSATSLCELVRRHALSPVEIMEAHLRRAEQLNSALNAIVTFAPDALAQARAAERAAMSGEQLPPLHGLPVTVKDTIATAHLRTTCGSRVRAHDVPTVDAAAVARLRVAGAIVFGKTNASELALDYSTDNPLFGRTNNPHDPARTPGGSSGGCAAAVSACLSPASLGSDLVGSIRIPAHCCGVAGLFPTPGRVAGAGHFPPTDGPLSLGASLGPLARRVDDLALLFAALADGDDSHAILSHNGFGQLESDIELRGELRGLRVACYTDDGAVPVTEETKSAVISAAGALKEAGLIVMEARPPGIERATELWLALFSRAVRKIVRREYAGREEEAGAAVRALLGREADVSAAALEDYFEAWFERDRLRAELLAWMRETPLLIAPVGAVPAFIHGARKVEVGDRQFNTFRAFSYAHVSNVFGLPAASVPAGRTRANLPIGVQIIGRPFQERLVLAAARVVEAACGGWQLAAALTLPSGGDNPL